MARDLPQRPDEPDEPGRRPRDTPHSGGDDERWDPVVGAGTRLSELELAGERGWLDSPDRPPRLDETRPYDVRGGLAEPAPRDQWVLEDAVPKDEVGEPERFPDVRETWFELVNDGGPGTDPFRGTNCLDCSLSAISTWHGEPQVAAPRYPEFELDGSPSKAGEQHGTDRAGRWFGHDYDYVGRGAAAFEVLDEKLRDGGDGSAAHIVNEWPYPGAHAWNAFNRGGEIVWADPQIGVTSRDPVHSDVRRVWAIVIDREGEKL